MLFKKPFQGTYICTLMAFMVAGGSSSAFAQNIPPKPAQNSISNVALATLDWQPYTGHSMPGDGAVSALITKAFESKGIITTFGFWPWKRAIVNAWRGRDAMIGYFPGYHCHHNANTDFVSSKAIVSTNLGFVYLKKNPLPSWQKLAELKGIHIGYVTGYASTNAFESLEASGQLSVIRTHDDISNLKKLSQGRLDAVLIDSFVFQSLMATEPSLKKYAVQFKFSQKILDTKPLYLCLRNDEKGRALLTIFDAALTEMDATAFIDTYFQKFAIPDQQ